MKWSPCFLLLSLAICFSAITSGQKIGLTAGGHLATMILKDSLGNPVEGRKSIGGFRSGINAEFRISRVLSIEPSVMYSMKGGIHEFSQIVTFLSSTFVLKTQYDFLLHYIELPVHLKATLNTDNMRFLAMVGPYFGIGLAGKRKRDFSIHMDSTPWHSESESESIKWGSDEKTDHFRREDLGISGGIGIGFRSFEFALTFSRGLIDINLRQVGDSGIYQMVWGPSLGYRFGTKVTSVKEI